MVEKLERIGGLRKEEFILLKALVLANSTTIDLSVPKNGNRAKDEETSVHKDHCESSHQIDNLRESLLNSLSDCVAVTRYVTN
jgi:hypothetical protein